MARSGQRLLTMSYVFAPANVEAMLSRLNS
jgi:hypothetical protein